MHHIFSYFSFFKTSDVSGITVKEEGPFISCTNTVLSVCLHYPEDDGLTSMFILWQRHKLFKYKKQTSNDLSVAKYNFVFSKPWPWLLELHVFFMLNSQKKTRWSRLKRFNKGHKPYYLWKTFVKIFHIRIILYFTKYIVC